MKTLKIIQNIFIAGILITAMYVGGGIGANEKNIVASYALFVCVLVMLVMRFLYEEKLKK